MSRSPNVPLDPKDYPGAPAENLVPGSLVFTPTSGPVDLRHISQWWTWTPGACWRRPEGPGSTIDDRADHPVVHVAYEDASTFAAWAGDGVADRSRVGVRRPRRPRRHDLHVGRRAHDQVVASWPTRGTGSTSRGAAPARVVGSALLRWAVSRRTGTGCSTWPATCGSGPTTGGRAITPTMPTSPAAYRSNPRGG